MYPLKTIILSFTCCLFGMVLSAQAPKLSTTADEVIVTGTRFVQLRDDSPQNVTVIDSATVAQSTDLAQLLNEQAGITINGAYSNPGKDKSIFLRNGSNSFTVILLDGQPLLDPSSLGGAVDLRLLSLDGIERIEILRGARSLLYGSDAVAGVINLISRKGDQAFKKPSLHLRAAAQNYGTFEGGVSVSGSSPNLDYQLGYDYFTTDGISEATPQPGTNELFTTDGAQRQNVNASLTYRPTENLSIRPSLRLAAFDGDYDGGSFQDADNTYTNDLLAPALAIDFQKGKTTVGGRYNFVRSERVFNSSFGTSTFDGTNQQADVFGTYTPRENTFVTAGVQLRDETLDNGDPLANNPEATTISPYLQLGMRVAESLLFEAGYRYNNHSTFGGQSNFSLALGVQTTEVWSSRLSIASAFQSPTLDQLAGPFGANLDLKPQIATSVELGTTLRDPEGNFSVSITAFQRNIKEVIQYIDFTVGYQNQNELLDKGVELAANGKLTDHLAINGNLSYVKGQLTSPDGNGGTTETEDGFFRRPRASGMLGISYSAKAPFTARLSGHYTGNRPDVWFDESFSRIEVDLDPYFLLNAYAEYRFLKKENLRLFLDARNLTNADFVEVTGFGVLGTTVRLGASLRL